MEKKINYIKFRETYFLPEGLFDIYEQSFTRFEGYYVFSRLVFEIGLSGNKLFISPNIPESIKTISDKFEIAEEKLLDIIVYFIDKNVIEEDGLNHIFLRCPEEFLYSRTDASRRMKLMRQRKKKD